MNHEFDTHIINPLHKLIQNREQFVEKNNSLTTKNSRDLLKSLYSLTKTVENKFLHDEIQSQNNAAAKQQTHGRQTETLKFGCVQDLMVDSKYSATQVWALVRMRNACNMDWIKDHWSELLDESAETSAVLARHTCCCERDQIQNTTEPQLKGSTTGVVAEIISSSTDEAIESDYDSSTDEENEDGDAILKGINDKIEDNEPTDSDDMDDLQSLPGDESEDSNVESMDELGDDSCSLVDIEGSEKYDGLSMLKTSMVCNDNQSKSMKYSRSTIDDNFLNVDEMNKFLDDQDKLEMLKGGKVDEESNDDSESEDIDYFTSDQESVIEGEDELENDVRVKAIEMKYDDFFKPMATSSNPTRSSMIRKEPSNDKMDVDDLDVEGEDMSSTDEEEATTCEHDLTEKDADLCSKTPHERRTERLAAKIADMESEVVSCKDKTKDWQMSGEVEGVVRPQNSLIEEHLDFEGGATSKAMAPIITEHVSKTLESIIMKRIKYETWDDVERKVKPTTNDLSEHKRKLIQAQVEIDAAFEERKISQQKSLSQVYEEEYLKQKAEKEASDSNKLDLTSSHNPTLDPTRIGLHSSANNPLPQDIKQLRIDVNTLFAKLDALTHHHAATPASIEPQIKLLKADPFDFQSKKVCKEDVAPIASRSTTDASVASLLTPSELLSLTAANGRSSEVKRTASSSLIGETEKSVTDKRRERRRKKARQSRFVRKGTGSVVQFNKKLVSEASKISRQHKKRNVGYSKETTGAHVLGGKFTK